MTTTFGALQNMLGRQCKLPCRVGWLARSPASGEQSAISLNTGRPTQARWPGKR
jgi:hypothetical protein